MTSESGPKHTRRTPSPANSNGRRNRLGGELSQTSEDGLKQDSSLSSKACILSLRDRRGAEYGHWLLEGMVLTLEHGPHRALRRDNSVNSFGLFIFVPKLSHGVFADLSEFGAELRVSLIRSSALETVLFLFFSPESVASTRKNVIQCSQGHLGNGSAWGTCCSLSDMHVPTLESVTKGET